MSILAHLGGSWMACVWHICVHLWIWCVAFTHGHHPQCLLAFYIIFIRQKRCIFMITQQCTRIGKKRTRKKPVWCLTRPKHNIGVVGVHYYTILPRLFHLLYWSDVLSQRKNILAVKWNVFDGQQEMARNESGLVNHNSIITFPQAFTTLTIRPRPAHGFAVGKRIEYGQK